MFAENDHTPPPKGARTKELEGISPDLKISVGRDKH